ncbi:hypothetical protein CHGG_06042 [Chaetomium globosum CBS 148.51]|uniref:Uncharacterized protein n=1 Tax=Chaetomium globosum (strain ATCC 6205 / CBS 148.51 / DSM 1962 / NBRC 6347 / NRRL 1970) TaxID=306901 RepID=Q2H5M3_CHAGB|nr:uncharacterized protein CHGG_06042 [Chaetomium globosum CBS 148.51]EAQ89423.1 hypothetical protein CHGG_06042 [Chaetomium globosum CBS 148.51]
MAPKDGACFHCSNFLIHGTSAETRGCSHITKSSRNSELQGQQVRATSGRETLQDHPGLCDYISSMGLDQQPSGRQMPRPSECLPVPHDDVLHFTRCLRFEERESHLQNANQDVRGQVTHWLSRVQSVRSHIDSRPEGEFWTARLADHLADLRSKPQPRRAEGTLAQTLSRLHIGSRSSQINIPAIQVGDKTLSAESAPNIAAVLARSHHSEKGGKEHTYKGLQAGAVYFKDGRPHSHPKLQGSFPDQTTPLADLLARDGDRSVLTEQCEEGMLRWFHIPANNASWVEEAIARHYNETNGPRMRSHQRRDRKHKCHVSIPQGWEGQSRAIEQATRTATLENASALKVHDRVEDNFHNELRGHHINETSLSAVAQETIAASMNHFRPMAMRASTRRGVIGRILFGAARIAKLMTSYEDDQLIGDYLYANPPLHPRRTLHQSFNEYANFLRDTRKLDQNQIVYRATAKIRDTTRQGCTFPNVGTTRELAARQELAVRAQDIWTAYGSPDKAQIAEAHKALMNINPEAGLMKQADNILSDLGIIRQIKSIQREVLEQYHIHVARRLVHKYGLGVNITLPHTPALRDVRRMREALDEGEYPFDDKKSAANWTLECADESELFLSDQYKQIDNLHTAAEYCHKRLQELLDTKNRYAGIVSAWEAVANSVEQSNQGKSIMLFSVLSIIS